MKKATLALAVLSALALTACQKEEANDTTTTKAATETTTTVKSDADTMKSDSHGHSHDGEDASDSEKHSYALGASMGLFAHDRLEQQKSLNIEYDEAALMAGFHDGLSNTPKYTVQELQGFTRAGDIILKAKQDEKANAASAKNIEEGAAYLAKNAQKDGVKVTESGLQYEILKEGTGDSPSSAASTVKVHYKGTLLDGTEFDSSYSRGEPATFPLNRVIPGWTEGLQLMKEGATYRFTIPSDLAYRDRNSGKITPNSTLIFDVELLDVIEPK